MYLSVAASAVSAFATFSFSAVLSTTIGSGSGSGSTVSFSVVKVTAYDGSDSFPAASTAVTVTVYSIPSVSPVRS